MHKMARGDDARNRFVPGIQSRHEPLAAESIAAHLIAEPEGPDERYFHEDIPGRSDGELRYEREQLRQALTLTNRRQPWAIERFSRIERELEVRRGN